MTPNEEIQRAIDKLNDLRARCTQGEWRLDGPDYHWYGQDDDAYVNTSLISAGTERTGVVRALPPTMAVPFLIEINAFEAKKKHFEEWQPTAEADLALIETLHATIDAQLIILRNGTSTDDEPVTEVGRAYDAVALILARAINGAS